MIDTHKKPADGQPHIKFKVSGLNHANYIFATMKDLYKTDEDYSEEKYDALFDGGYYEEYDKKGNRSVYVWVEKDDEWGTFRDRVNKAKDYR